MSGKQKLSMNHIIPPTVTTPRSSTTITKRFMLTVYLFCRQFPALKSA